MNVRILQAAADGATTALDNIPDASPEGGWVWIDISIPGDASKEAFATANQLGLDPLAFRGAVEDSDLSKVDDLGSQLIVVLHGLRENDIATYDLHCFLQPGRLVTVARHTSPALDVLWSRVQESRPLAIGGVDELVARIADVLARRLLLVLAAFEDRIDELVEMALEADDELLEELTVVRADLSTIRRVVHPQREALDLLRRSTSDLISQDGRRRFSDVFDVASRTAEGIDAARAALAETLEAYRGAEARQATDVMKVLTIYTAIMLPLTLVVGFFGMNFANLPLIDSPGGWTVALGVMLATVSGSVWVFIAVGWIHRPGAKATQAYLRRGLSAAARAPVQIANTAFETAATPLRALSNRKTSVRKITNDNEHPEI